METILYPISGPANDAGVADEPGELLGFIDPSNPIGAFEGYTNKEATAKKVLTDVLAKGDKYFRTGDLPVWRRISLKSHISAYGLWSC